MGIKLLVVLLGCSAICAYRSGIMRRERLSLIQLHAVEILQPSYGLVQVLGLTSLSMAVAAWAAQPLRVSPVPILAGILAFLTSYAYQKTESVRYRFDSDSFSLVRRDGSSIGPNPVMGGEYAWDYKSIRRYKVVPSRALPIFLYIEETKTPVKNRIPAPFTAAEATSGAQVHYFPLIADIKEIERNFRLRSPCVEQLSDEVPLMLQTDPILFVRGLQLI